MPVYDYRCPLDHKFERISPMSDDRPVPCPECGQLAPQIISVPSPFVWGKGGGWK